MHIEHSSKINRFCASRGGSAARSAPPIAKAKATPHAMRFNMPGIRCLVHRRIFHRLAPVAADPGNYPRVDLSRVPFFGEKRQLYFFSFRRFSGVWSLGSSRFVLKLGWKSRFFCDFVNVLTSGLEVRVFLWFCRVLTSEKMFNLLPCPNSIRYSWFWSGPERQARGDSSLWPPGTVTKLPSGTSPGPPQNPKIQNPQNPKSPKSKIQNPQNPKSQNPKSPQSKIQNPQNPKIQNPKSPKSKIPKIQNPNFFGRILGILDLGFCIIRKQFFTWGPQRPKFWISADDLGFWILGILDFGFWGLEILDFGDFGFWILGSLDFGFCGRNPKSQIQNPQSKLFWPNFLHFGFWILDRYVAILYVRPQRPIFWILAGILNFGFWKLGIQDFGFWGFWILDFWNIM